MNGFFTAEILKSLSKKKCLSPVYVLVQRQVLGLGIGTMKAYAVTHAGQITYPQGPLWL